MLPARDDGYLDFSENLNPYGLPVYLSKTKWRLKPLLAGYADPYVGRLRNSVGSFFKVSKDTCAIGTGSTEILFALPRILQGKRAVLPYPAFWEYEAINKRAGVPIEIVRMDEARCFSYDFSVIENLLKPGDVVYLSNVCNPTSQLMDRKEFLQLVSSHQDCHFVVDETYLLFRSDFQHETLTGETVRRHNLHVVTSYSKFFSLPGIRIGFLFSNPEFIAKYMEDIYIPYSVSRIAEQAVVDSLLNSNFVDYSRLYMDQERDWVKTQIQTFFPSRLEMCVPNGNFVLAKLVTGQTDKQVNELLSRFRIHVRLGSDLPGLDSSWIRFAIRLRSANRRLLGALNSVLPH